VSQARICRYAHPAAQGIHRTCEWSRAREVHGAFRCHSGRRLLSELGRRDFSLIKSVLMMKKASGCSELLVGR
jgi:hypothetical protein